MREAELKCRVSGLLIFALLQGREPQWPLGSGSEYSLFILQPPATPGLFRTFWVQTPGHEVPAPAPVDGGAAGALPLHSTQFLQQHQITLHVRLNYLSHINFNDVSAPSSACTAG